MAPKNRRCPVPVCKIVPVLVSVPAKSSLLAPERVSVPELVMPPGALIVPPLHWLAPAKVNDPLAVSVPELNVKAVLMEEVAPTVSTPLDKTKDSSACKLSIELPLVRMVMVGLAKPRLITTSSPVPGTEPPLQLPLTSQKPSLSVAQETVAGAARNSSHSAHRAKFWERRGRVLRRG